jgi:hypothetical protein
MDSEFTGGCEGKYLQKGLVALIAVVVLIFIYYVYIFMKDAKILRGESMCGGGDQLCSCAGNETMVGGLDDNVLSRKIAGH